MGLLDILGISKFSKVKSILIKNNLIPQVELLEQMKANNYSVNWDEKRRDLEIKMLVLQKVNYLAAGNSLVRFDKTKDICYRWGLEDAGKQFENYVNLYTYYLANYNELGGPTSW